ncbi:lactonase family protein [Pelagicoccus mobilis]|uniref:Lactonase family protein n=1 Tax=Pelagicoccus mobilis TaxID=415221 RepID=A0A934S1J1_9BACT|nr:lactonase family protein [Pelagicoccus mobilis]MBK1879329.1 lactonase family protein [Pelagicoccus mobilis]
MIPLPQLFFSFFIYISFSSAPTMPATPLYIASADNEGQAGIYLAHFDPNDGSLSTPSKLIGERPFFFKLSANGEHLYLTTHQGQSDNAAALHSYRIEPDNTLAPLNSVPFPGRIPLHIDLHPEGTHALVANYLTPTVVSIAIREDGSLSQVTDEVTLTGSSIHPKRQDHSYPHSSFFSPDGKYAYVCDRGTDRLGSYAFDPSNDTLTPLTRPIVARPGAGPRHLAWHPDGTGLFVINEINGSLTHYAYDTATGYLSEGNTYPTTAPDQTAENFSAEVRIHPNGKFIYASNRGPDTLAVFKIADDHSLTLVQRISSGGQHPRYFEIHPSGEWLIVSNKNSDNLTLFSLDPATGQLTAKSNTPFPAPTGLAFR